MGNRADPVLKSQPAGDHDGLHSHELGGGLPPPPTKPTVTHMHNHEPGGWLPPPPTGSTVTHMHSHHQMALDIKQDAQLSHRLRCRVRYSFGRESGSLELGDNISRTLWMYLQPVRYNRPENLSNLVKKC